MDRAVEFQAITEKGEAAPIARRRVHLESCAREKPSVELFVRGSGPVLPFVPHLNLPYISCEIPAIPTKF
jgi:hypothetical protein